MTTKPDNRRSKFTFQVTIGNIIQIVIVVGSITGSFFLLRGDVGVVATEVQSVKQEVRELKADVIKWEKEVRTDQRDNNEWILEHIEDHP